MLLQPNVNKFVFRLKPELFGMLPLADFSPYLGGAGDGYSSETV